MKILKGLALTTRSMKCKRSVKYWARRLSDALDDAKMSGLGRYYRIYTDGLSFIIVALDYGDKLEFLSKMTLKETEGNVIYCGHHDLFLHATPEEYCDYVFASYESVYFAEEAQIAIIETCLCRMLNIEPDEWIYADGFPRYEQCE